MLLSIIIPTRNRQTYCIAAVKQILSLNLESTEIVIQDNSDNLSIKEALIKDGVFNKVVYHYHPGQISFVDNFSEPLDICQGEYVCMIGDDDGILPNIIDEVKSAKSNGYDAIVPGLNSVYFWPSENPIVSNAEKGYLSLTYLKKDNKKDNKKEVNVKDTLNALMLSGGQNYQDLHLPRLYHGIVRFSKIREIKEKTGRYFYGLTPDIYMAVALCYVCRKMQVLEYPVTISGICPRSGSSDSATGKHTGELKDAPHFKGHDHYEWQNLVPYIYTVESIWAESVIQALNVFGDVEKQEQFSVLALDSIIYQKYPQFRDRIIEHASINNIGSFQLKYTAHKTYIINFIRKVFRRISRKPNDIRKFYNVNDIKNAELLTINYL